MMINTIKGLILENENKELLGLPGNKPIVLFFHRVKRRERRGALLGREPNAPCYLLAFPRNVILFTTFKIFCSLP